MSNGVDSFRWLVSTIVFILFIFFLLSVLKTRWNLLISVLLLAFGIVAMALVSSQLPYEVYFYRMLFVFIALTAYAFLIFKDKPGKIVLAAGMMYLDEIICEVILLAAIPDVGLSTDWIKSLSGPERAQILIFYTTILGVLLFLTARLFSKKSGRLSTKEWLLFALFPISQAMLLCLWFLSSQNMSPTMLVVWQIISGVICIAVDVSLYLIIRGISQRAELKAQNELLAKQIAMQKIHYVELSEQYQRMQILRHDIANHMHTIQVLLKNEELHEARSYSSEILKEHTFHSTLGQCENPIVDAFITSRIEDSKAQNIPIEADVRLPYRLSISDPELIALFGNLLDNAVEACLSIPADKRFIHLATATKDGFLAVRMENCLPEENNAKKTVRIEGLQRGFGFHILESIAKQYHGSFTSQPENDRFVSTITLKLDGEPQ